MSRYLTFFLIPFLAGCGLYPTSPMHLESFPSETKAGEHLLILLAGQGAGKRYFVEQQWIAMARKYGIDIDFVSPHAHLGYYMSNSLVQRVHDDVIEPAIQKGYKTISIAGISMGGLGATLCSQAYPEKIDRVYLIAPYLGKEHVHDEIRLAGSLNQWQLKNENKDDWNYFIWQRLKEITEDPALKQKLFLGYGLEENLKPLNILSSAMPKQNVIAIPGGHKDVVFTQIWKKMLQKKFIN